MKGTGLLLVKAAAFAIITLFAVFMIVQIVREPLTATGQGGRSGTATVTRCTNNGSHECYGDFVSDNGSIHRSGVRIWGDNGARAGTKVRAVADQNDRDVIRPGSQSLADAVIFLVIVGGVWLAVAWWLFGRSSGRRRTAPRYGLARG